MTRVLVNLLWLVPGVVGGSEESTTDSLRAVADLLDAGATDLDVHLAVLEPFGSAHPDLAARLPTHVLDLDGREKWRRVLAEQTWLARRASLLGAEVVHHAGGLLPLRHPGRSVLTVHDLQPLDHPRNFRRVKRTYIRAMAGRSARGADVVAVPSEFTRGRVIELLDADPDRVVVVPWWVPPPPATDDADRLPLPPLLGSDPFLLYPAITYPHKNHLVLMEAFAAVARSRPDLRLVLTGGAAAEEGRVTERIGRPDLVGRVLRTGRVPAGQLESLFAAAVAVTVPSSYEGFGLPVLEAMVRGVPVIAADAGSLPEVARAEDLVASDDVEAWAAAIGATLDEAPAARAERIAAGRARAARFTAGGSAAALTGVYRRAGEL